MTYGQLGWIDGLSFGFASVLEIPSGAMADLLGRKRTLMIGFMLGTIGSFFIAIANNMEYLFMGWMIMQFHYTFYSGSAEALVYDSLVMDKKEKEFDRVISTSKALMLLAFASSALVGGYIYEINYRIPNFMCTASVAIAFCLVFFLQEPPIDTEKFSLKSYWKQTKAGFAELIKPVLRPYLIFFLFGFGSYYLYSQGFLNIALAEEFGYFAFEQGIIIFSLALVSSLILKLLPYFRKKVDDYRGAIIISSIMGLGFVSLWFPLGYWGIIPIIIITLVGDFINPWVSVIVNQEVPSRYRATVISTVALLVRTPYVFIAIFAGFMLENGYIHEFALGLGVLILLGVGIMVGVRMFIGKEV